MSNLWLLRFWAPFKSKFSFLHPDQKITLDHSWEKLELGSLKHFHQIFLR